MLQIYLQCWCCYFWMVIIVMLTYMLVLKISCKIWQIYTYINISLDLSLFTLLLTTHDYISQRNLYLYYNFFMYLFKINQLPKTIINMFSLYSLAYNSKYHVSSTFVIFSLSFTTSFKEGILNGTKIQKYIYVFLYMYL